MLDQIEIVLPEHLAGAIGGTIIDHQDVVGSLLRKLVQNGLCRIARVITQHRDQGFHSLAPEFGPIIERVPTIPSLPDIFTLTPHHLRRNSLCVLSQFLRRPHPGPGTEVS